MQREQKNLLFLPLTDSQKTRLVVSYDMAFLLFGLHFDLIRSKLSSKKQRNFQPPKEQLFGFILEDVDQVCNSITWSTSVLRKSFLFPIEGGVKCWTPHREFEFLH